MYDQTRDHPGLVPALALMRARFVHLVRHDSLSAIVSFDIAHARDRWHYHAGERGAAAEGPGRHGTAPDASPGTGRRDRAIPAAAVPPARPGPRGRLRGSPRSPRRRARRADRLPRRAGRDPPAAVDGRPPPSRGGRSISSRTETPYGPRWLAPSTSGSRPSGSSVTRYPLACAERKWKGRTSRTVARLVRAAVGSSALPTRRPSPVLRRPERGLRPRLASRGRPDLCLEPARHPPVDAQRGVRPPRDRRDAGCSPRTPPWRGVSRGDGRAAAGALRPRADARGVGRRDPGRARGRIAGACKGYARSTARRPTITS